VILITIGVFKVRGRQAVSKQAAQKFDVERFTLKKLSEPDVRKECEINISNTFAPFENLINKGDINGAWEYTRLKIITKSQPQRVKFCKK